MLLAYIPSPAQGVWHIGPIPIRAYALCIIAGIIVAVWLTERRWIARGGRPGTVTDIAVWAVVFGLVGGRLYHVITDPELYFAPGKHPIDAFKVWQGGLGIWGAIALGGVGAWIACRRRGIRLAPFADAAAPGIVLAQGIGRWGNYFNQELFGRPTTLPWGLEIDPGRPGTVPGAVAYHPTFLYESIWDVGVAILVIWADRRFRLGRGRAFALYVMAYTVGRFWIEMLRIDHANHILGMRVNDWTSLLVFAGATLYFLLRRGPRETVVEPAGAEVTAEVAASEVAASEVAAQPAETENTGGESEPAGAAGTEAGPEPAAEAEAEAEAAVPAEAEAGPAGQAGAEPAGDAESGPAGQAGAEPAGDAETGESEPPTTGGAGKDPSPAKR